MRTATLAVTVGAASFAFIGGIAGSLLALAARPVVSSFAHAPLSPWGFGVASLTVIGAVAGLGGLLGILSGRAFRAQRLRQVGHPAQPLSTRQLSTLGSASAVFALAGVYILATSEGGLWTLVLGSLARELRTLRPVGAVLYGCGMPRAWMRRAFVMCALLVVSVAVVAGAVMCAVQATLLQTKLPTVFAMSAAPWWVLAAFLGIAMAASVVAVARVTRNPSIREAIQA